jgi:hypothetical protein
MSIMRYTAPGNLFAKMLKLGDIPRQFGQEYATYDVVLVDLYYGEFQIRIMGHVDEKNVSHMTTDNDKQQLKCIAIMTKEFKENPDLAVGSTIVAFIRPTHGGDIVLDAVPLCETQLGDVFKDALKQPVIPLRRSYQPTPIPTPDYYPDPVPLPFPSPTNPYPGHYPPRFPRPLMDRTPASTPTHTVHSSSATPQQFNHLSHISQRSNSATASNGDHIQFKFTEQTNPYD